MVCVCASVLNEECGSEAPDRFKLLLSNIDVLFPRCVCVGM